MALHLEENDHYQHLLKNSGKSLVNHVKDRIREEMMRLKKEIYFATGRRARRERMQALEGKTWQIMVKDNVDMSRPREVMIRFMCTEIAASRASCRIVDVEISAGLTSRPVKRLKA